MPRRAPLTDEEKKLVDELTSRNREKAEQYLNDVKERVSGETEILIRANDDTSATLHEMVEDHDVDLVILSAHGYSGEAQWPYGSIALNFIAYGTTPLLIVQDLPDERQQTLAEKAAQESKGH